MKKYSLFIIGVLSILVGMLAWLNPLETAEILMILLGVFYVVSAFGIFLSDKQILKKSESNLVILFAAFMLIIGIGLIVNPVTGAAVVIFMMGFLLLISGISRLAFAFSLDSSMPIRGSMLLSAVLSILLSIFMFSDFPSPAAEMLGMLFAIELILDGIATIAFWFALQDSD